MSSGQPSQHSFQAGYNQGVLAGLASVWDPHSRLQGWFSRLKPGHYEIRSNAIGGFNCIAWAAGNSESHWWPAAAPGSYWPTGIKNDASVDAFVEMFATFGYLVCDSERREVFFEKVAIYAKGGSVQHAARQRVNGIWSSKCGNWELIDHEFDALTGHQICEYGDIVRIMKRRRSLRRTLFELIRELTRERLKKLKG